MTAPGALPTLDEHGRTDFSSVAAVPIVGDGWLRAIRELVRFKWSAACAFVLELIVDCTTPALVCSTRNEQRIMDAWNSRVLTDNVRLHNNRDAPPRSRPKRRSRPDLRLGPSVRVEQRPRSTPADAS